MRRKVLPISFLLIACTYVILQIFFNYHRQFRINGWQIVRVKTEDTAVLTLSVYNERHFPFRIDKVEMNPAQFEVQKSCVLTPDDPRWFGHNLMGIKLPSDYETNCRPVTAIKSAWDNVYVIDLIGEVKGAPLSPDGRQDVVISYTVLGWPHKLHVHADLYKLT